MPAVGDRHDDGIGWVQEWTGDAWAPVCPTDDVPMSGRDDQGWLRCDVCGKRTFEMEPR
jgi:hypothetical protein